MFTKTQFSSIVFTIVSVLKPIEVDGVHVSSRSEIVGKAEDRAGNLSKKPFAMSGTETRELRAIMNTGYPCPPQ